ncbi:MAG: hypothetical protein PHQ12_01845 [Chthoniobacteraceae bacterium]|nr:hypothetical protein [Chthoniobacteraceae bacterium]
MPRKLTLLVLIGLAAALLNGASGLAEPPAGADTRLRETLRNTMLQLRTAQNDNTALQTAKAELEKKAKELDGQIKVLTKRGGEDRDAAKKEIDSLNAKLEEQARALEQFKKDLAKSQADLDAARTLAQSREAARKALEDQSTVLNRTVADQKAKNAEMYKLGRDILLRYEKFGLGEALGAKEPFVGTTRVKLENYVQDFQDKLTDQKIKP